MKNRFPKIVRPGNIKKGGRSAFPTLDINKFFGNQRIFNLVTEPITAWINIFTYNVKINCIVLFINSHFDSLQKMFVISPYPKTCQYRHM